MIYGFINSNDRNKITMGLGGGSSLDNPPKISTVSPMEDHEPAAAPGSRSPLIQGAPNIRPDGKYDTPPMAYVPGGNNQPFGRILSKAMEDIAFTRGHLDSKNNAGHIQLLNHLFDDDANRFVADFFRDKYPGRKEHQ
jgi:hypothetical protein